MSASNPQHPNSGNGGESTTAALLAAAVDDIHAPVGHRGALWSRIEERREQSTGRRRRSAVLVASLALVVASASALVQRVGGPDHEREVAASAERFVRVERQAGGGVSLTVEPNGELLDVQVGPLRAQASATTSPVHPYEAFGSASLGHGVFVTGATQGATADGQLTVALVAVAVPDQALRVRLTGPGEARDEISPTNPVEVLALALPEHDPMLELKIEVLDASGGLVAESTILPFSQTPWTCATNPEVSGTTSTLGDTTSETQEHASTGQAVGRAGRWFTAPLPAACL